MLVFIALSENYFGDSLNASRLMEIRFLIESNIIGESIAERLKSFTYSYNAFINYPIFGSLTASVDDIYNYVEKYGNHSTLLDTFAFYGVGIGLLITFIYFKPILDRIKAGQQDTLELSVLIGILLLIIISINLITASIGFAVFFIFPTVYDFICHRKSIKQLR